MTFESFQKEKEKKKKEKEKRKRNQEIKNFFQCIDNKLLFEKNIVISQEKNICKIFKIK